MQCAGYFYNYNKLNVTEECDAIAEEKCKAACHDEYFMTIL